MNIRFLTLALLSLLALVFLALLGGAVYLALDEESIWSWLAHTGWWEAALVLCLIAVIYVVLDLTILAPLAHLTKVMGRVVQAQHPGFQERHDDLRPGLDKLHRYLEGLTELATHDPLTRLNNRIIFEEKLKQALLDGRRSGKIFALVFLDIDDFYRVNQEFGSYVADALLRQLGQRLTDLLRESDTLARLEKDNFALLLDAPDREQLDGFLDKLHQQLVRPYRVYGRDVPVAISLGAAIYPDHGRNMVELSLAADEALLKAQEGDWPVVLARQSSEQGGFTVIQALRKGIERDEFTLVYQPVVRLSDHRTHYFEALLRWKEPQAHDFSIAQIIQMAEASQMIRPLTNWIIDTACRDLARLKQPDAQVAINLSMIDLHDDHLPERVGGLLQKHGVAASSLQIEITEGQIMQEPDRVIDILGRLNAMGLSLTIDDFGTGQASLTYLRRLPVKKLKIDQSFVKDMVSNSEDRAIVEATIKLAHTLDIGVVAEGVETAAVYDLLEGLECDYVQGYYMSKPLAHDQISHWCNARRDRNAS